MRGPARLASISWTVPPDVDLIAGAIGILMTDPDRRLQIEAYESIYCYRTRLFVERQGFAATGDIAVRRRVFRAVGPTAKFRRWKTPIGGCARRRKGCRLVWLAGAKVITSSCILRRVGTAMGPTCRPRISQTRDRLDGQASMADHIRPRRRVAPLWASDYPAHGSAVRSPQPIARPQMPHAGASLSRQFDVLPGTS
ncbi:hypothetical protein CN153_26730 [Sinorhizobium meliloti]|nr:hypothetical protein CN199_20300 [Sinorhizobium meliloti]RVK29487.1 hypothetical protein CN161_25050 [Sinorhizobium meliloti]RVK82065.1 hypothetical protein CN153_26730 [Sinorhizobium meliloti]RVL15707.1 hypothetical protein CN143_25120 [Sinorhizobium meliloti]RVO36743.1 hypothetical protein CN093_21910 [Sinorhizobium meliloti]